MPSKIRLQILKIFKQEKLFNIGNRAKAIKTSIMNAEPNEVILVAGKVMKQSRYIKKDYFNFR